MTPIIFFSFALVIILALILTINSSVKQSKKDWNIYYDLEKRANLLNTKEEIEAFHKEFVEKAKKINNPIISAKLGAIDGYVKGLYKQYKK